MIDNTNMNLQQRIDYLKGLSPRQWEAMCKRCGICCLVKHDILGKTVYTNVVCDNLELATKKCNCYSTRLKKADCCKVDLQVVLDGALLPASCAYSEFLYGPAKFLANVDFSKLTRERDFKGSITNIMDSLLPESIRWNTR